MWEHKMLEWKLGLSALVTALTSLWGWFGWLTVLWLGCLLLDYITGSMAAARAGQWNSKAARDGIWHKLGAIVAVTVSAAADLLLGLVTANVPGFPLAYSTVLCPMVMVWYTLTELGSIVENALRLGAPIPAILQKALKLTEDDEA